MIAVMNDEHPRQYHAFKKDSSFSNETEHLYHVAYPLSLRTMLKNNVVTSLSTLNACVQLLFEKQYFCACNCTASVLILSNFPRE